MDYTSFFIGVVCGVCWYAVYLLFQKDVAVAVVERQDKRERE